MWNDSSPAEHNKLKVQNHKLRTELKQINEYLQRQIDKKQKQTPTHIDADLKDDTLRVELVNAQKQIKIQQKQISVLLTRQEMMSFDNVANIQAQLKCSQDTIKELSQQNKILQKINNKQEKQLTALLEDEIIKKRMDHLEEENRQLKSRIQLIAKTERSISVPKADTMPIHPIKTITQKQLDSIKEKDDLIMKIVELDKYNRVLCNLKLQYDKQISGYVRKLKISQQQVQLLSTQLNEKTSEYKVKQYILPNLSSRYASKSTHINKQLNFSIEDNTIISSDNQLNDEEIGIKMQECTFSDVLQNVKLQNIKVWWDCNQIKGIQGIYIQGNTVVYGNIHSQGDTDTMTQQHMQLSHQDYIVSVVIGIQDNIINFIEIQTHQNYTIKFGQEEHVIKHKMNGNIFGCILGSFNNSNISSLGFKSVL